MKLSFSLASKRQSGLKKPSAATTTTTTFADDIGESKNREYVTEFDSSNAPIDPTKAKEARVIPPKANEWRPHKRMKNLDLPLQSDGSDLQQPTVQFEVDPLTSVEPSSNSMSYGLNLRSHFSNDNAGGDTETKPSSAVDGDLMLHKLREDLKRLPDEDGLDDFADMPVEGFGRALLAGYGWQEGKGIGRNAKEDVKVVEYKRRTAKEGLGFTGELPILHSKYDHDNGNNNNIKKISERLGERGTGEAQREEKGLYVGKDVRIVGGREMGLKARVLEVNRGGEFVILRLLKSEEDVKVHVSEIADLGSVGEERCLRKLKELRIRERNEAGDRKSGKDRERDKDLKSSKRESRDEGIKDRKESRRGKEEIKGSDKVSWLTSHIRVRIISKELKGGRLYLKKGEVVDVVGLTTCDISMDEGRELIQGVDQELLETALPKRGGPVLVLYGRHKGVYGSLVERDTDKETGVVRDADTHELLNVSLEQIAEYLGDPSYIGY